MQVAIVSDIHGNRHAFEAVLEDVSATAATATRASGRRSRARSICARVVGGA